MYSWQGWHLLYGQFTVWTRLDTVWYYGRAFTLSISTLRPVAQLRLTPRNHQLLIQNAEKRWVQGINQKHVTFINPQTVCHPCGNFIIFTDTETKCQSLLQCPSGSIGAFAVNMSSEVVAFSDKKLPPNIHVFTYPGLVKRAELKGAAQLEYSLLAFSHSGHYLGSYSSVPDHLLTIWNWQEGVALCSVSDTRSSFTSLTFNPMDWHQLCLSSEEALTLWNIEVCDTVYHLKSTPVKLLSEDGILVEEDGHHSAQPDSLLSYFGPQMPLSAIAGLVGDTVEGFMPKEQRKPCVKPSTHCWSSTSNLFVGCEGGQLLSVNPETQKMTILNLTEPSTAGESPREALYEGNIKTMALHRDGLYVGGNDGILWLCSIKGSEFKKKECLNVKEPIESISLSSDYKALSVATHKGSVYIYKSEQHGDPVQILNTCNDELTAADFLTNGSKYCLSVGQSGEVQFWSLEDGANISSLNIDTQASCLACCPSSHYAVIGSSSGHIFFVDAVKVKDPRIIARKRLYHVPVLHLHFDQKGNVLVTGAADGHIFILDARPSSSFQVLGYTVVGGDILSLSLLSSLESHHVKALALVCPSGEKEEEEGGTQLELFSLALKLLQRPSEYIDQLGMLKDSMIQKQQYKVEQPLFSAVLGGSGNAVYGYCCDSSFIYKFALPKETSGNMIKVLPAEKKVCGSQLGRGYLGLSPHHKWLSVSAADGILYLKDSFTLETYAEVCCHSYHTEGIGTMAFSLDGHTLITTGVGDGAVVCLTWRHPGKNGVKEAFDYGRTLSISLQDTTFKEDEALRKMPPWSPDSNISLVQEREERQLSVEVTEQDDSYTSSSVVQATDPTWLNHKFTEAIKEEEKKYADQKKSLRNGIKELRHKIQAMMRENESLPEIEKLDQQEFNLDTEEQERLRDESEQEVERVRKEIELENLSRQYLREIIKKECWDSMSVTGRSIMSFHTEQEVTNYPLKERTAKELEDIARVLNVKKTESVDLKIRKEIVEVQAKIGTAEEEEVEEETEKSHDTTSLIGSLSDQYGGDTSNLYSQLEMHSREEKINQIILLQDIIYNVKTSFNKEFEVVYRQKEQEVTRVNERNQRIYEIMSELNIQEKLLEPKFTDNEKPERALTVDDSEIKVEKYLTPEQKAKVELQAKQKEEERLAAQEDNAKQRALNDMMGGVLEVKKEDILRMEVTQPGFLSKAETEWTEEEKKQFKEYDKKFKELNEEKEKYRKILEAEMKKIQVSIMETTLAFDEILTKLFEKKVHCEMVIYQNQTSDLVKTFKAAVESFRESYDDLVAEDKLLDRGFKKEFSDVQAHHVDQLYKLYKKRPRVQRLRTQTESEVPFGDRPGSAKAHNDSNVQLMKAMDELDDPVHMPEGLDLAIWERFCLARRSKMEYEQQVKRKALVLAEMQEFLHKRIEEDERTRQDIEDIMQELNILRNAKMKFQLDLTVQFILKQGQVEVENSDLIPNYTDAILLHRSVIEDLNSNIRGLGEQKIASMVESKDFRKGIFQLEWEHKKIQMEMEDLKKKSRDITMLRVTKEIQTFLNESNYDMRISSQMQVLEETINVQEKQHEKNIKQFKQVIKDLEKHMNRKKETNTQLDKDLQGTLIAFSERKHIYDVVGVEQSSEKNARDRYIDIVQRRKLVDLVKAQAQEITMLRTELDRLRMKTFPALVQMEY
ncbi:cilia- and flagella-associated protein 43 isoform X2 [Hyla sarda]|uniref:cilia- and flagella-associated protein 43 isoform X2 n=1 Tax=Hyla sarda TaxID=327740 RepID=UPI0024C288C0|nr:cilia- and flagella-associated protein 43 isoform X2 [Hyla sarda]